MVGKGNSNDVPLRIQTYLKQARKADGGRLAPATTATYQSHLVSVAHAASIEWADIPFEQLNAKQLGTLIRSTDLADSTMRFRIHVLRSYFAYCADVGYAATNVALDLRKPRRTPPKPNPVTDDDKRRTFLLCSNPNVHAWLTLALTQGMRCHELAAFQLDWIDGKRLTIQGKGGKVRHLPMRAEAARALALHREHLASKGAPCPPADGPYFRARTGSAYTANAVSKLCTAYLRSVGVNRTAHKFRHRFGSDVFAATGNLELARVALGHTDIATTRHYVPESDYVDLVDVFGDMDRNPNYRRRSL